MFLLPNVGRGAGEKERKHVNTTRGFVEFIRSIGTEIDLLINKRWNVCRDSDRETMLGKVMIRSTKIGRWKGRTMFFFEKTKL